MKDLGRIENAVRNIFFGYIGNFVTIALGFTSRTIFIYTLGVTYLGVSGLFSDVLSVLSLAELGIGISMNFSLYKPVAKQDNDSVKSLMQLYKKMYRVIALVITVIGLVLVPFLKYIVKDAGSITLDRLTVYYLIFLVNTVSTYFVSYKYSLLNAEQKGYIQTNIDSITTFVTVIIQIFILLVFKNFLAYLLTGMIVGLSQKVYVNFYMNRLYPLLTDKNVKKLPESETSVIKKNIIAMFYHRIGEVSVHQTDNIIISSFINVAMVGIVSNYSLIISSVSGFINVIFNSVVSGFGNLIATEGKEKQYDLFKVYRFLGFWIFGWSSIMFFVLISPFIELWIGKKMLLGSTVVYLIIFNYYLMGGRIVINNFKIAAGIFNADKYISIVQAVVNLIVSVALVKPFGLAGVYIGTICAGFVSTFTRPYIVYHSVFGKSVWEYFNDSFKYLAVIGLSLLFIALIIPRLSFGSAIVNFVTAMLIAAIIPNIVFYIVFRKRKEFKYLSGLIKSKIIGRRKEI